MSEDPAARLRALMRTGGWKAADVALILEREVQTVYAWLSRPNRMPAGVLRILELMIRVRTLEHTLYGVRKTPAPAGRIRIRIRRTASVAQTSSNSVAGDTPWNHLVARNRRRGN